MKFNIGDPVMYRDTDGFEFDATVVECHRNPWGYSYTIRFYDYVVAAETITQVADENSLEGDDRWRSKNWTR